MNVSPISPNHAIVWALDFAIRNGIPESEWGDRYETFWSALRNEDADLIGARDKALAGLSNKELKAARRLFNVVLRRGPLAGSAKKAVVQEFNAQFANQSVQ